MGVSDGRAPRGAAFFDLDRTLMEGSSAFQYVRASYRAGVMSRRQLAMDAWANIRFRLRGSTDEDAEAVRDRAAAHLAGTRVVDIERMGADVLAGILPRLYPQMLAVAHEHQDAGRPAYIVTAAPQELADMLAPVIAFDGAIGSRFSEVLDGVYTGQPTGAFAYGDAKAAMIRGLAAREGIDLSASYAYSDSSSDLPMLRAVGHPVAVNPDHELGRIAGDEGWEVLRFDRLGRRLKAAAAVVVAATAGGMGTVVVAARSRPRRQPPRTPAGRAAVRLAPRRAPSPPRTLVPMTVRVARPARAPVSRSVRATLRRG
jgi:HAD superfamily hydrolase (TIGR01490 family)